MIMALNTAIVANALVATPNPVGSAPFGPTGFGATIRQFNTPSFVKFVAEKGFTYTVSTNVAIGDLVVTGPNGNPLNPGGAIKAFAFTPNQTALYVVGFVPSPRFVVLGQPISISIQAVQAGVPTDIGSAL